MSSGSRRKPIASCWRCSNRQGQGKFQNGVRNAGGQGIDWTDWNGNPTGYEGYLADSFRFLQAVLLREPAMRARYYRPMQPGLRQP